MIWTHVHVYIYIHVCSTQKCQLCGVTSLYWNLLCRNNRMHNPSWITVSLANICMDIYIPDWLWKQPAGELLFVLSIDRCYEKHVHTEISWCMRITLLITFMYMYLLFRSWASCSQINSAWRISSKFISSRLSLPGALCTHACIPGARLHVPCIIHKFTSTLCSK